MRSVFVALLWIYSNRSMSSLRTPELGAGLWVRSHQSGVEGQNHLPRPAGYASLDEAQDMVGFLSYERILLGHVQLFIHWYPQVLLGRAALNPFIPQPVLVTVKKSLISWCCTIRWHSWALFRKFLSFFSGGEDSENVIPKCSKAESMNVRGIILKFYVFWHLIWLFMAWRRHYTLKVLDKVSIMMKRQFYCSTNKETSWCWGARICIFGAKWVSAAVVEPCIPPPVWKASPPLSAGCFAQTVLAFRNSVFTYVHSRTETRHLLLYLRPHAVIDMVR